jgi:hypothetical protein
MRGHDVVTVSFIDKFLAVREIEKDFIKQNKKFWPVFTPKHSGRKLLVEEPSPVVMIVHSNSLFSVIINQATALTPVWLQKDNADRELLKSYVSTAETLPVPELSLFEKLRIKLISVLKFIIMYLNNDVLSFSYDGVRYGDVVYDSYLLRAEVAKPGFKRLNSLHYYGKRAATMMIPGACR